MKSFLFLFLVFFSLQVYSQEIHPKLIGSWETELIDTKNDTEYVILIKRFEDGFFDSLLMILIQGQGVEHYAGTGKWWTEGNNLFLEYHQEDSEEVTLEKLEFEIINDQEILIQSKDKERPKVLRNYIEHKSAP